MIPNPICKVLSTLQRHEVRCLLMGGQACILYGAAEFSRDSDFVVLATDENLARFRLAMSELQASVIAVPPLSLAYLERGHAVHFRCEHPDAQGIRIDIMSRMRGVRDFPALWEDRTTVVSQPLPGEIHVLGLPDLVAAKKTVRDKDWPMIKRLVDASFLQREEAPTPQAIDFWLLEMRTPELLIQIARQWPDAAHRHLGARPLLAEALSADVTIQRLSQLLNEEEQRVRDADRLYWLPLRQELELLRHTR